MSCARHAHAAGLHLEHVRRLSPDLQHRLRALAAAALAHDGVRPFGEHKWLRLVRGDDCFVALLLWEGPRLVGAAHCFVYHTPPLRTPPRVTGTRGGESGETPGPRWEASPGATVGALTAELVVEPARREHGFGRRLLGAIFDLARTEGAGEVHLWAYGDLPPARHLAEQCHCRPERVLLQYGLERARLPTRPGRRADVRLRRFEPSRDAYSWLVQHQRVFAGHPEQSAWDATDLQLRLDQPWFEAQDFLIAEDARSKAMLGFCWTKLPLDADQPGEIYIVGVDPAARGRGLGQLLTWAGLAHIRARGRPGATLYVEADNAPARRLYEGFGFRVQHTHVCYRHSAF